MLAWYMLSRNAAYSFVFIALLTGCSPYQHYFWFDFDNAFVIDDHPPIPTPHLFELTCFDDPQSSRWMLTNGILDEQGTQSCDFSEIWQDWPITQVSFRFNVNEEPQNRYYVHDLDSGESEISLTVSASISGEAEEHETVLNTYGDPERENSSSKAIARLRVDGERVELKYFGLSNDGTEVRGQFEGLKELLAVDCNGCGD